MEIIVIIFIAGSIGSILAVSPLRDPEYTGVLTIPAAAVVTTSLLWSALLWAGNDPESAVMWIVPAVVGAIVAFAIGLIQKRVRPAQSRRRLDELLRG